MNNSQTASVLTQLRARAAADPKRIIFPETTDPRVIQAARLLQERNWVTPVVVGTGNVLLPSDLQVAPADDPDLMARCAQRLFENRRHKGLSQEAARSALQDPLLLAAALVSIGFVDGSVAGSIATTASVIRAGLYGVGTAANRNLVSSFFLMQFPDFCLTYADCGVVPDPNAEQLSEIAITSAESHHRLTGVEPRVALLSFSTLGSADHPRVEKIRRALEITRRKKPDLLIEGELQFDAAFVPHVAQRKAPESMVAGQANVMVFPDLDSGNIAYKISERLAGAQALGPLVQGLARPFMDLSRGCSVEDICDVAVIASILSDPASSDRRTPT